MALRVESQFHSTITSKAGIFKARSGECTRRLHSRELHRSADSTELRSWTAIDSFVPRSFEHQTKFHLVSKLVHGNRGNFNGNTADPASLAIGRNFFGSRSFLEAQCGVFRLRLSGILLLHYGRFPWKPFVPLIQRLNRWWTRRVTSYKANSIEYK